MSTQSYQPGLCDGTLGPRTVSGLHELAFRELVQHVEPSAKILDLGAGTGAWAARLIAHDYQVTALDRDECGFGLTNVPFIQADLDGDFSTAFSEQFDVVTALEVIEHLENPTRFLRQCRNLLRDDGGILLLTTPNIECAAGRLRFLLTGSFRMFDRDERFSDPTHISPIQSYMFEKMTATAGLQILSHTTGKALMTISRPSTRLLTSMIQPFMKGNKAGDNHVYVLSRC